MGATENERQKGRQIKGQKQEYAKEKMKQQQQQQQQVIKGKYVPFAVEPQPKTPPIDIERINQLEKLTKTYKGGC